MTTDLGEVLLRQQEARFSVTSIETLSDVSRSSFTSKRSGTLSLGDGTPTRESSSTIAKMVRKTAKSLTVERTCTHR